MASISKPITITFDANGAPNVQANGLDLSGLISAAQKNPEAQGIVKQAATEIQKELQESKVALKELVRRDKTLTREEAAHILKEYSELVDGINYILNEGFGDKAKDLYYKAGAAATQAGAAVGKGLKAVGQFTKDHPKLVKGLAIAAVVALALTAGAQDAAASELIGTISKSANGVAVDKTQVWGTNGSDILGLITQYQQSATTGDAASKAPILGALKQMIGGQLVLPDGQFITLASKDIAQIAGSDPNSLNWLNQATLVTKKAIDLTTSPVVQDYIKPAMKAAFKTF